MTSPRLVNTVRNQGRLNRSPRSRPTFTGLDVSSRGASFSGATVSRKLERFMSATNSLFVRAAKAQPSERTPVWFMRQAGRYMPEYRSIRKSYSLIEICKKPEIAAQVTIEAAEILRVDAAIIFADLLLPLEVMGLPFHFAAGGSPKNEKALRTPEEGAPPPTRTTSRIR